MSIGPTGPGGLPLVGAQAALLGMQQFNQSVRQVTTGLGQINSASLALERNSTLATTRMTSAFASMSSAYLLGGTRMAATFGVMSAGLAGLAVAAVSAGAAAVTSSAAFQKAMTPVQVFGDLTKQQTATISDSVLNMSRTWGVAAGEIAKGETALVKAGASFDDLNGPLAEAVTLLNVASEGELSMAESADIVTQAMRSWKLPTSEAINFVNALVGATNASTAGFRGMVSGLGQSQTMAAATGITYQGLLATLGMLNDENIRGERAGTALRNLQLRMLSPTKDVAGVMARYSVSLSDANGNMIDARQFIERMSNAFSEASTTARGLSKAQVDADLATLGMSRSLLGALAIANQGTEAYDKYQRAIAKTDVRKIAEAFNANTIRQAGIFATNLNAIAITFGGPFNESIGKALANVNKWMQSINLHQVSAIATAIRDGIGSALSYVSNIASRGLGGLGDLFKRTGVSSTVGDLLSRSLGGVLAIVRNLSATWGAIWANPRVSAGITSILGSLERLATGVLPIIARGLELAQTVVVALSETIKTLLPQALDAVPWEDIGKRVDDAVTSVLAFLNGGYKQVAQDVYNVIVGIINGIIESANKALATVGTFITTALTAIQTAISNIATSLFNTVRDTLASIGKFFEPFMNVVGTVFDFVADTVTRIVTAVGNAIDPLVKYWTTDVPKALGPVIEAIKVAIAIAIVMSTVYNRALDGMKRSGTDWGKVTEQAIADLVADFKDFVVILSKWFNAMITNFETVMRAANIFGDLWRGVMRGAALSVADFAESAVAAFAKFYGWLEQQPIIGKFFQDLHIQFDSARADIEAVFNTITSAPGDAFKSVRDAIDSVVASIDGSISNVRKSVDDVIGAVGDTVSDLGAAMQKAFDDAKATVAGILPTLSTAGEGIRTFLETMLANARASIKSATPEVTAFIATIESALAKMQGAPGAVALPGLGGKLAGGMGGADDSVGFPEDQAGKWQKFVAGMLKDIPALTEDFTEYIAKLTEADPNRLQGIVAALNGQRGALQAIGKVRLEILQTDIKLAQVDEKIAAQQRDRQRIELDMEKAMLPYEQKLLDLRHQSLLIAAQMQPLQDRIADIDKKIALAQRENLDLRAREINLRQKMLPIENQIAEIDRKIADTQREQYDLDILSAQIRERMLPVQNALADIEKQIARNSQENYGLTRQRLQAEQAELPLRRQIEDIDIKIAEVRRTNYDLVEQELAIQADMLQGRQDIALIDRAIADQQTVNYNRVKQLAELDQQALPYKQRMKDLEQQITDIVDKRSQLERDRNMLMAEHDLKATERSIKQIDKQLDDLWAKFGTSKGATRSALIPQIIDLEAQKKTLADSLKPAQALVDTLKDQQDEIDYNNNLTKIGLQIQETEQEALLAPINAQIDALKKQQETEDALTAVVVAGLNARKAAIQATLDIQERQLLILQQQQEREEMLASITVAALEHEKQGLEDNLRSYDATLLAIKRIEEEQKIATDIANSYLNEQADQLRKILDSYEQELTFIERQKQAYQLRNDIIRLGLEQEKARLEAINRVWQDQLDAINQERAAEDLRNAAILVGLEAQKRALEDQLIPLQNAKDAIDRQTNAIVTQQTLAKNAYDQQLLSLKGIELETAAYKLQLDGIRASEQTRLGDLIQKFQDALTKSGSFTATEVTESVKRLNLWQGEVDKLSGLKSSYDNLLTSLGNSTQPFATAKNAFDAAAPAANSLATAMSNAATNVGTLNTSITNNASKIGNPNDSGSLGYNLSQAYYGANNLTMALNGTLTNLDTIKTNASSYSSNIGTMTTAFNSLATAVNSAQTAMANLTITNARYFAVQATAGAAATAAFSYFDSLNGISQRPKSAQQTYEYIRDLLAGTYGQRVGYANGGFVSGAMDQPQMAVVHGGEYVVSRPEQRDLTSAITRAITTYNQQHSEINYNFTASYERQQDPITASMDMRALIEMTR